MSEVTALKKFNCTECGAEAVWNPSKKTLVCPYCGTISQTELKTDGSGIQENELFAALTALPENDGGWQVQRKTVKCQSCQAISVFDPARVAQNCDFCGSPAMISADDISAPVRPEAVMPFHVAHTKVREDIRQWYASHWFAPNNLGKKALTDTLHGIYLPFWTFDAQVHADWEAEAGHKYTVRGSDGKSETRIRWEYASGSLDHFFDDFLIPASRGVHPKLLHDVAPFPTTDQLMPYDPGYLTGWVVEQYQIDLKEAAAASKDRMDSEIERLCIQQIPGDTHRNLRVQSQYSGQTFKHVLLPVWLLTYNYGSKTYQVAVNGITGKIAGEYPLSWIKIAIVTIIGLIILGIIMAYSE